MIELKIAAQSTDTVQRRWFSSTDMDLIVWHDDDDALTRFELYYDKSRQEHVMIWRADRGFSHLAVDDGEQKPAMEFKQSPMLVPDGHVDPNRISRLFERSCRGIPDDLAAFVGRKLKQHPFYTS
jgi:hypothetical protein